MAQLDIFFLMCWVLLSVCMCWKRRKAYLVVCLTAEEISSSPSVVPCRFAHRLLSILWITCRFLLSGFCLLLFYLLPFITIVAPHVSFDFYLYLFLSNDFDILYWAPYGNCGWTTAGQYISVFLLGFCVLSKDASTSSQKELGIKPLVSVCERACSINDIDCICSTAMKQQLRWTLGQQ